MASMQAGVLENSEFAALAADLLQAGRHVRFRAGGLSMQPFIRDGDILLAEPAQIGDIRVGDIALFTGPDGRARAHRILARHRTDRDWTLVARGDRAISGKEAVTAKNLLGRVVSIERDGHKYDPRSIKLRFLAAAWRLCLPFRYIIAGLRRHLLSPDRDGRG